MRDRGTLWRVGSTERARGLAATVSTHTVTVTVVLTQCPFTVLGPLSFLSFYTLSLSLSSMKENN